MRPALSPLTEHPDRQGVGYEPVGFADLAGWADHDPRPALEAFQRSCPRLSSRFASNLATACETASRLDPAQLTAEAARAFFEAVFVPHRVVHEGPPGLVTGYFEPELAGAREPSSAFQIPLYRRPPELVALVDESRRGTVGDGFSHAMRTVDGLRPMPTRAEIEQGALAGHGLEVMYVTDPVDAFILHVQGSGRIRLVGGQTVRITYDGKNGHPYASIGRHLIEAGIMTADAMSLDALAGWLRAHPERGREAMWRNPSFVFFRELCGADGEAPLGVDGIALTAGRSLAIDTGVHAIGLPVWVAAPTLTHAGATPGADGFARLMIAQDTGSAIRGPERGDIFFGSDALAGALAGITKHAATFHVLLPPGGRS